MNRTVGAFVLVATAVGLCGTAHASDCNAMIAGLAAYLQASDDNGINVIVTTNQSDKMFASAGLHLNLHIDRDGRLVANGGSQYFSDRGGKPFSGRADLVGLRISTGTPARVDLILETPGNSPVSGIPSCQGNVMFGAISDDVAFSLSFHKGKKIVVQ